MDVIIWLGMCGNGVMTGIIQFIITVVQQIIRRALIVERIRFFVAVLGTAMITIVVLIFAACSIQATGEPTVVSVVHVVHLKTI